jgi:hypothetical protein
LSAYLAFSGTVRLAPWNGNSPLVQTCPFLLQAIVYDIVVQQFKHAGPDAALDINVESRSDSGWGIVFSNLRIAERQGFPDDQIKKAAASIAVIIDWDRTGDHLELHVPSTI